MEQSIKRNRKEKDKDENQSAEFHIMEHLEEYCSEDYVPMHMPGHKRNTELFRMQNPFGLDITEIDGFDNLHKPENLILESMEAAAGMYGAYKTYYSVSGSSECLMAAICGITKKQDQIMIARNSHISVYNAVYLNELNPVYIYPENVDKLGISGQINPQSIESILKKYRKKLNYVDTGTVHSANVDNCLAAIVITSPTYEGNISDIRQIADIAHQYGAYLIVDEAHGAHFPYSADFPESALKLGADVVVQSVHKTLPSLTQTALLHIGKDAFGTEAQRSYYVKRIERYLGMYQSTSPSYLLMGGIDGCLKLLSEEGEQLFAAYTGQLKQLRKQIKQLKWIKIVDTDDISKIVLYTENGRLQGRQLYDILLHRHHIQLEMASAYYVIAMTSVGDRAEYYERFLLALQSIDQELDEIEAMNKIDKTNKADEIDKTNKTSKADEINHAAQLDEETTSYSYIFHNEIRMNPYQAMNAPAQQIDLKQSVGRVSADFVSIYPPGIPVVCPGEQITKDVVSVIQKSLEKEFTVIGVNGEQITCLK